MNGPVSSLSPRSDEFAAGAALWPAELSRRDFLQLMGASLALAGVAGCNRMPAEKIVPYVLPPEKTATPDAAWYATAMPWCGYGRGVLAKSVQGRPIKLEGNPDHPESLGGTDAVTQAAILGLYDPDRSRVPERAGQAATWAGFESEWVGHREVWQRTRGAGLAILTEPTTSPSELRALHALLDQWPEARWYQHTALARFDRAGRQWDFDFAAADVVLTLGGDGLFHHPAALRYARAFASRRRIENGQGRFNRLYTLEPTLTLTGAQADLRLGVGTGRLPVLLNALSAALTGPSAAGEELGDAERAWVKACASRVRSGAIAVCLAGPEMPDEIGAWAEAFNRRFGGKAAWETPAVRSDGDARAQGGLSELVADLERGEVTAWCALGVNAVGTAPGDLALDAALRRAALGIYLGEHADETASLATWHLPESHFLESWGDLRGYQGQATLQQPLLDPLHESRSRLELLYFLRTGEARGGYDLVRETWRVEAAGGRLGESFEEAWRGWLEKGVMDEGPAQAGPRFAASGETNLPVLTVKPHGASPMALFRPDANVFDGRWANNAWLQELPQPFTSLVWENAALIDAGLAGRLGVANGDVMACEADGRALEAPVWVLPGQAPDTITLPLGYGRTSGGAVARGRGFAAQRLRRTGALWERPVAVRRTGRRQTLVSTQEHFTMDGRDLARVVEEKELERRERAEPARVSLFPEWPRDRYAWGMSIDLGTCIGCSACVVACQAENNIPVVGREQVGRGREMHWIRIDRYFSGAATEPRVLHQPVTCMQCENAPCEVVCPVAATVHSSEGLNDMVYNRCVGTRYCSNNCPYKVRRFNFLDFRPPAGSSVYLQSNPDVTVRERGVMEKCTYCVQRINAARVAAERENRRIRDGEARTACQQACPVEAIVFGDLNDPESRVSRRQRERIDYALLEELNTRPRTRYLAKVVPENREALA
jgi:molybdopterin-containing oxidoreductase family iron-sulfur binding subunit